MDFCIVQRSTRYNSRERQKFYRDGDKIGRRNISVTTSSIIFLISNRRKYSTRVTNRGIFSCVFIIQSQQIASIESIFQTRYFLMQPFDREGGDHRITDSIKHRSNKKPVSPRASFRNGIQPGFHLLCFIDFKRKKTLCVFGI